MNQILITEKLYITPELKRKKKLYKINFIISVFLLCLLFSYYIYAEYDKYAEERKSQEILANMDISDADNTRSTYMYDDTTIKIEDNEKIVVILADINPETTVDTSNLDSSTKIVPKTIMTTQAGEEYYSIGKINIPKIGLQYPILDHWSYDLLKMSPCKFHGADPNEVGNLCIVGHNYRTDKLFSKVPTLQIGDTIEIEDSYERKINYIVYDKHEVTPDDNSDTSQITHGKKEITLITCTNDSKNRVIVKAREEGK